MTNGNVSTATAADDGPSALIASGQPQAVADKLGPATAHVEPLEFVKTAHETLARVEAKVRQLRNELELCTDQEQVKDRCSVSDLHDELASIHKDSVLMRELGRWQAYRTFNELPKREHGQALVSGLPPPPEELPTVQANPRKRRRNDGSATDGDQDEGGEQEDQGGAVRAAKVLDPQEVLAGDRVIALAKERDAIKLRIMSNLDNSAFATRTRLLDMNLLTALTYSSPAPPITAGDQLVTPTSPTKPFSELLYTITVQPVSQPKRRSGKVAQLRMHTMHVLASTTLWEIKLALTEQVCRTLVPKAEWLGTVDGLASTGVGYERDQIGGEDVDDDDRGGEQDDASETSESSSTIDPDARSDKSSESRQASLKRPTTRWVGRSKTLQPADVVWTEEASEMGSVFMIENALYADGRDKVQNYSLLLESLFDKVDWTSAHPSATRKRRESTTSVSSSNDDEDVASRRPPYTAGPSMQETRIGDIVVRIGQPYWFMHDGDCEHVLTIDEIRLTHPADPEPRCATDSASWSTAPYPISVFSSRSNFEEDVPTCTICSAAKAVLVTIDDELAGESPAPLCRKCFDFLHGHEQDEIEEASEIGSDDDEERQIRQMRGRKQARQRYSVVPLVQMKS
ncbi:hypothetical protein OIV83_001272 [Microbotryomycetes sp. JL201]|nr:hypothetical protein OIV83_001272 [Microbotryomycetes sp. JL201]